jgi:hypothetical protein
MHLMQQIINEAQVQCGGNNIALMQTKVACEALSDTACCCFCCKPFNHPQKAAGSGTSHRFLPNLDVQA